jgi:hypothetical protein
MILKLRFDLGKRVELRRLELRTSCMPCTLRPSPHVAGRGPVWRSPGASVAGRGLASPGVAPRWLPTWLPELVSVANLRRSGLPGYAGTAAIAPPAPAWRSTSATRTHPGSAAATRTPTACSASTSPREQTSAGTPLMTSRPSPPRSTAVPAKHWAGKPRPKPSTSSYNQFTKAVLRRPLEPKLSLPFHATGRH